MDAHEALLLVRAKYLEERSGVTNGPAAKWYQEAEKKFPAAIAAANSLWARELAKDLP